MDAYHHRNDAKMPCQEDSTGKADSSECKCLCKPNITCSISLFLVKQTKYIAGRQRYNSYLPGVHQMDG